MKLSVVPDTQRLMTGWLMNSARKSGGVGWGEIGYDKQRNSFRPTSSPLFFSCFSHFHIPTATHTCGCQGRSISNTNKRQSIQCMWSSLCPYFKSRLYFSLSQSWLVTGNLQTPNVNSLCPQCKKQTLQRSTSNLHLNTIYQCNAHYKFNVVLPAAGTL